MADTLTHGSLFAGIGGFELAAKEAGIKTLWNCEIEPYPRLVLSARFPDVKQYGDIHKLNGAKAAPVDIITFGSPCQSFSVAGARSGLDGASGLFYEAVRIIREMRRAAGKPRYAIMENVPGIYSSKSSGKSDFREVLNELLKVKDPSIDVPLPVGGKFLTAGAVLGDNFSLAWRTLCASKFGVAQRRRRMFLVVDFDGERASEILSEQEGERRDFTPSYGKGKGSAGSAEVGVGGVTCFEPGALKRIDKKAWSEKSQCLRADMGDNQTAVVYNTFPLDLRNAVRSGGNQGTGIGGANEPSYAITAEYQHGVAYANHSNDSRYTECKDGVFPAITKRFGDGGNNVHLVLDERKHAAPVTDDYVGSLTATDYKGSAIYFEPRTYNICSDSSNSMKSGNPDSGIYESETAKTLDTGGGSPSRNQGGTVIAGAVCYQETVSPLTTELAHQTGAHGQVGGQLVVEAARSSVCYQETVGALCASDWRGIRNQDVGDDKAVVETFGNNGHGKWNSEPATLKAQGGDYPGGENMVVENHYAVRRLTPLECLRLQGFPDYWFDNIDIQNPTDEQIEFWRGAWAELGKKKSDNQLKKWLADPYSDSNAYKAIGNSLAVPCALWVLRGIVDNERQ